MFVVLFLCCSDVGDEKDDFDSSGDDDSNDDSAGHNDDDNDNDDGPAIKVGFSRTDISPDHSLIMAGYGFAFLSDRFCRWSTGVHDPIYATAVAFEFEGQAVVLIHLDVIGVILPDVESIQEGVSQEIGIDKNRVIVCGSHSHSSPDTMGLWGVIYPMKTGRDPEFIVGMIQGAINAGKDAYEARQAAILTASTGMEDRIHYNPQGVVDPNAMLDNSMTLLAAFSKESGRLIGTLMSWGCHPMIMGPQNTLVSAEFPGAYYRLMDQEVGGVNMYVNTTLGGTVHPHNPFDGFQIEEPEWGTWENVENFARILADDAQDLIEIAEPVPYEKIRVVAKELPIRIENPLWMANDLIPREVPDWLGWSKTKVTAFSIGDVRFATVPGELVPDIGLELRQVMGGDHQFLINLGMDWFGYILTRDQFFDIRYIYFSALCIGPSMEQNLVEHFMNLFAGWD